MSLSADDISEIGRLLAASHFGELKLEMDGFKLKMRSSGAAPRPVRDEAEAEAAPVNVSTHAGAGEVDVPAPMLGIFYHAAKPGAEPFVTLGSKVEPTTIIGIIEVMKLMNTARAGVSGIVTAILVGNSQNVEEGEPLIRVRIDG